MKIRRVFNIAAFLKNKNKSRLIATLLPIVYKRDRHIVENNLDVDISEKRLSDGALINFRYVSSGHWWFEATTGLETEHVKSRGTSAFNARRTGLDDIVLAAGYYVSPTQDTQAVVYGIAGFPTHRKVTLLDTQDPLVGTRFFGLGCGAEFSYLFINSLQQTLLMLVQGRFVHFFDRKWFPILPCDTLLKPGNLSDILFTIQYRKRKNIFEVGYNTTLFSQLAVVSPSATVATPIFVRQSMYATYAHIFKHVSFIDRPLLLGLGFNVARLKRFDTKISAFWLNLSTLF